MLETLVAKAKPLKRQFFSGMEAALFALVLALLVLVILQVFTRYVMQMAIPWTEEVARMLLVWMVMIGASISAERNEHYAITFISARLRGTTRLAVLVVTNVLGLVFLYALVHYGSQYALSNLQTVYVSTQTSRALVYIALPSCALVMAMSMILQTLEAWLHGGDSITVAAGIKGDV